MRAAAWIVLVLAAAVPLGALAVTPSDATRLSAFHGLDGVGLPPEAFPGDMPLFAQRDVGTGDAFEPPLAFAPDGTAFFTATTRDNPTTYPNTNTLWRSSDDGAAWEDVTPFPVWTGVDPFLATDPVTGRVFASTYHDCLVIAFTDDAGDTWTRRGPLCDTGGVTDYPSIFIGPAPPETRDIYPSAVYVCYHAIGHQKCQRSLDGGLTFLPMAAPWRIPAALAWYWGEFNLGVVDVECEPFIGGFGHADPVSGTLYFGTTMCGYADVSVSRDFGLSWQRVLPDGHDAAQWWGFSGGISFATDAEGTTYALWVGDDDMPRYSYTRDQGATWAPARRAFYPGLVSAQFLTLAAGDAGRVAIGYVGSTAPGGFNSTDPDQSWHAFVTVGVGADGASPVFATTTIDTLEDPLRRGPCLYRCSPEPDVCGVLPCWIAPARVAMGDYLFMRVDPTTGNAWMSLVDLCNGPCAEPGANGSALYGVARASVGVQVGGLRIQGT